MKEEIIKNLAGIIEYVKQGADFIKEQAPLYVQEMINYKIWVSCFEILLCAVGFIASIYAMAKLIKYVNDEEEYDSDNSSVIAFGFLLIIMFIIFLLIVLCVDVETVIQATVAPRVFVVEQIMKIGA